MLLYIHVPFCRQKCRYCAFHSVPLLGEDKGGLIANYHNVLLQEMELWAQKLCAEKLNGKEEKKITSIFFGGGTPSLLEPSHIGAVIENAAKYFDVDADAEITMEANPESLGNRARCRDFLSAGINRLSLGVQSLDDELLKLVGRPHTAEQAVLAYATARSAGFENISLDFIWGLPSQTTAQWLQQVRAIIELDPEHLSAYGLTLEDGTPLKAMCEKAEAEGREGNKEGGLSSPLLTLADEASQEGMFLQGSELLRSAGYEHYEISNFAQEDCQCRHNLGYWSGEDYLGLGPAAVSAFYGQCGGQRRTNPYNHKAWAAAVEAGFAQNICAAIPCTPNICTANYDTAFAGEIEELSPDIMAEEYIMLALRTSRGIVFSEYTAHTGHDFMSQHKNLVNALCSQGLAIVDERHFTLTTQGMLASNEIMERFF